MNRWKIWCWIAVLLAGVGLTLPMPSSAEEAARKVVAKTAPAYPELARKMHLSGKVKLSLVVDPEGAVTAATMVGGNPVFEKSAVEAVKQWRFERGSKDTQETVVLEFSEH